MCVCTQKACSFGFSVFSAVKWSYWYNQHSLLRTNHKGQFVSLCSFGIHANAEPRQYRHTCLQAPFSDWFIGNPRQVTEALLKLICRVGGKCRSQRVRIEWGTCNYLTFILKCILYKRWERATKFLKINLWVYLKLFKERRKAVMGCQLFKFLCLGQIRTSGWNVVAGDDRLYSMPLKSSFIRVKMKNLECLLDQFAVSLRCPQALWKKVASFSES